MPQLERNRTHYRLVSSTLKFLCLNNRLLSFKIVTSVTQQVRSNTSQTINVRSSATQTVDGDAMVSHEASQVSFSIHKTLEQI